MWFAICAEGMLDPSVKDKVQQLLCDASMGDLAKWKSVSKVLMDEKVMYKMKLKADELLVHPQNRGGMGLQVFSMHAKGQRILQCGCDLSLLGCSTCIELNPDPTKRQAKCKMMQSLHATHPEYVAPVSGHERYMSLSSSHVSQFFKAMLHGCKSPEADLVDAKSGKMSLALVSDPEFLKGAAEGWEWTVIPFYVEDACHKFLSFLFFPCANPICYCMCMWVCCLFNTSNACFRMPSRTCQIWCRVPSMHAMYAMRQLVK